ncbi:Pimeloyl-ACP methyl ester carboxylesterase [Microbacterium sp. cf046]|uniref:alpha/beta fold hydrolase n=1 Tax=Microbacterium sp. cf046 TaxID=1761803 RepID=UPI0008E487E0|nr:alpha/beta hydrolase [Microbacterium sp. cf046]SFR95013.1 Pimeloyl-ACP methyl ester carboxylesterase [Microbacterium sp. cf046]
MTITDTPTTVRSADGTQIAFFRAGSGPAIILVDPALSTHTGSAKLSAALASRFTVISYDRRGRGASGDEEPDAADPAREVEDLAALIEAAGGRAILFGSSSGAALAIEAAARLGDRVSSVVAFEPPYICDDSRPPVPVDLAARIAACVAAGDRSGAAKAFFHEAIGMPAAAVAVMRVLPLWRDAKALTPTLRFDFAVLEGTQQGEPLPAQRWSGLSAPLLVLVGSKSPAFFHRTGRALATALPRAEYEALEGAHHGSPQMSPASIAARIIDRFA